MITKHRIEALAREAGNIAYRASSAGPNAMGEVTWSPLAAAVFQELMILERVTQAAQTSTAGVVE